MNRTRKKRSRSARKFLFISGGGCIIIKLYRFAGLPARLRRPADYLEISRLRMGLMNQ